MTLGHRACLYIRPFNADAEDRQARRAPRYMTLGRWACLYTRPFNADANDRQARRRCLFLRSAPDLGVWRPKFRAALPNRPGADVPFSDRHQSWEFGAPQFRGRATPKARRADRIRDDGTGPRTGQCARSWARRAGGVLDKGTGPRKWSRLWGNTTFSWPRRAPSRVHHS